MITFKFVDLFIVFDLKIFKFLINSRLLNQHIADFAESVSNHGLLFFSFELRNDSNSLAYQQLVVFIVVSKSEAGHFFVCPSMYP